MSDDMEMAREMEGWIIALVAGVALAGFIIGFAAGYLVGWIR